MAKSAAKNEIYASGRSWKQLTAEEQALFSSENTYRSNKAKWTKNQSKNEPHYERVRQALDTAKSQGGHVRIQDSDGRSYMVPAADLEDHMRKPGAGTGSLSITHLLENYDVQSQQPGPARSPVEVVEPSAAGSGPTVEPGNEPGRAQVDTVSSPGESRSVPAVSRNQRRRTARTNVRRASALSGTGRVPQSSPFGYVPAGSEPVAGIEDNPPPFQEMGEEEGAALARTTQRGSATSTEEQERRLQEAEASYRDDLTRSETGDPVTDEILSAGGAQARASGGDAATINEAARDAGTALGQRFRANPQAAEKFMQFGEVQTAMGREVAQAQSALRKARSGIQESAYEDVSGGTSAAPSGQPSAKEDESEEPEQDVPDLDVSEQVSKAQEAAQQTANLPSTVDYENEADLFDVGPGELPPGARPRMQTRPAASIPSNLETAAASIRGGTTVTRGPGSGVEVGNSRVHALRALVSAVQEAKAYPEGKTQPVPKPEEDEMTPAAKKRLETSDASSVPYNLSHPERTREEVTVTPGLSRFQRAEGLTEVPTLSPQQQRQASAASQDAPEHPMYGDLRRLLSGNKIHQDAEHPLHDLALSMGLQPKSSSLEHIQEAIQQHLEGGGSTSPDLLGRKAPVETGALAKHMEEVDAANQRAPVDTQARGEIFHNLVASTPDEAARPAPDMFAPTTGLTTPEGNVVSATVSNRPMPRHPDPEYQGGSMTYAEREAKKRERAGGAGKVSIGTGGGSGIPPEKRQANAAAAREAEAAAKAREAEGQERLATTTGEGPPEPTMDVPENVTPVSEQPAAQPKKVRTGSVAPTEPVPTLEKGQRVRVKRAGGSRVSGGSTTTGRPADEGAADSGTRVSDRGRNATLLTDVEVGGTPSASGQTTSTTPVGRTRRERNRRIVTPGNEHARPAVPDAEEATADFARQAGSTPATEAGPPVNLTTEAAPRYSPTVTSGARNRIERRRGQRRIGTMSTGTEVHRGPAPVAPPKSKLDTEGKYRSEAEKVTANPPERVPALSHLEEHENIDPGGLLPHESVQVSEVTEHPKPETRVSTGGYEVSGGRTVVAADAKSPDPKLKGPAPTPRAQVLNTGLHMGPAQAAVAGATQQHLDVLNEAREAVGLPKRSMEEHHAQLQELAANAAASQQAR